MKQIYYIIIILFILVNCLPEGNTVTTTVYFLRHGIGARATGMGESFVGMYSDVTAACWNPAGLSNMKRPELSFMHSDVMMDVSLEFLGFAYPLKGYGICAINSILYLHKPVPVTDNENKIIGELSWLDFALTLSYSRKIKEYISGGISLKLIQRTENDPINGRNEGTGYALDCGIIYETQVNGLNLGLAFLNIGTQLQMDWRKDDLPRTIKTGLAYEKQIDDAHKFIVTCDFNKILESNWYPGAGVELNFKDSVFVRTGYFEKEANVMGITYGFGFKFGSFQFDYSNVPAGEMVGYTRSTKISFSARY